MTTDPSNGRAPRRWRAPADPGRRKLLRRAALATGAAAAIPLLAGWRPSALPPFAAAATSNLDPDRLFTAGRFSEADRGYAAQLRDDPTNAHAMLRRGYIALISNSFDAAQRFLTAAIRLSPGDDSPKRYLASCFMRQDLAARAAEVLRSAGDANLRSTAVQYASLRGNPYEIHGPQTTSLPYRYLDPLPIIMVSIKGAPPKPFVLDTGATFSLTPETATEAGLVAVSTGTSVAGGRSVTEQRGSVDSIRLGDLELRNVPVAWFDHGPMTLPDGSRPAGVLGTTVLYHFLSTMDYKNRALVLRRKTPEQQRAVEEDARRAGIRPLPLWLAGDHFPCTIGSLSGVGPAVVVMDSGGPGLGLNTTEENARRAGAAIDYAHPLPGSGGTVFPITVPRASLGGAVRVNVRGSIGRYDFVDLLQFDPIANFTHEFFTPFAVTFDFTGMKYYIG